MIRKYRSDNHFGPGFEAVVAAFPKATRAHWSEQAFRPSESCWLVGIPNECGGGPGIFWIKADSHGNQIDSMARTA